MEVLLKNLAVTVELLAMAEHSGSVQQWDGLTLSRAFHWARYCEHVFNRFNSHPAIRRLMEQQLVSTNSRLRAALPGYTGFSFPELSRCQHRLLLGLLSNPDLPCSTMKILCDSSKQTNLTNGDFEGVTGVCDRLIRCKAACKVLRLLNEASAAGADAEVQSEILMERLEALLSHGGGTQEAGLFLGSLKCGYEGAEQHFCRVIAVTLLTEKRPQTALVKEFVLNWLQREHRVLLLMCSTLSGKLLSELSRHHQHIKDSYLCVLNQWASEMEYSLDDGEWTNTSLTFRELTERFVQLLEACPSLRESTVQQMSSLKTSDGDFDVEGLSVWRDLVTALNQ